METTLIPKCDGGLRIVGDSMYPLLKSGDIVFYKQVHDIMHSIIWGEMYLISFDIDGDEYVSVEHLFLALLKQPGREMKELIKTYGIKRERLLQA